MSERNTSYVRAKKSLGQHFLHDQHIAARIVESLIIGKTKQSVLEIGPGMGVLTRNLIADKRIDLAAIELDRDSVAYLKRNFENLRIIEGDFLKGDMQDYFTSSFSIIGNFPYNISSQIFFKVLEHRNQVDQVVCMLQKEVAERIAAPHGSKTYGILSVLLQAFYRIELLFKVPPGVFHPPPKVMSAVIRLLRNDRIALPCDEGLFVRVVKQGFNNRRKTLRNALKPLILPALQQAHPIRSEEMTEMLKLEIFDKRAEQLSVDDFIYLTQLIEKSCGADGTI